MPLESTTDAASHRRAVGVIGAGFHATTNILPACVRADVQIQGIATRDIARSAAALLQFGSTGTPFDNASALIADPAIESVIVVAQPADQARISLEAIQAGRNVFADKPLGWTAAEATELADAADAAGVTLMVGFMKRYAPVYEQLAGLIADGELGDIRSFHLGFGCDSTAFCANEEEFLKLAAIHVIDLVRALFGEVTDVAVSSSSVGRAVSLAVLLEFESGVVGTLDLSGLPSYSSESERVRVTGEHGFAVVEDLVRLTVHTSRPHVEPTWASLSEHRTVFTPAESAMSGGGRDLQLRGFVGEIEHFIDAVQGGTTPRSSGRDNVLTMHLLELILAKAQAGGIT